MRISRQVRKSGCPEDKKKDCRKLESQSVNSRMSQIESPQKYLFRTFADFLVSDSSAYSDLYIVLATSFIPTS